ncbi:prepilin peptidase [Candidatus Peribacteria bacterium]|nr:prepilin peptidase [Candidatus Peribacteria bacterium]
MTGIVWMFFGTLFAIHGYSFWIIGGHLFLLSMLLILAIEDIRSFTIPDRLSLPMIGITLVIITASYRF